MHGNEARHRIQANYAERQSKAMKIYTKTGDDGETGLFGGPRVRKDAPRIEAYGTVDELNAVLGMARCENLPAEIEGLLARVQNQLFNLGAELSTPQPEKLSIARIGPAEIAALEQAIDRHELALEPLKQFILPGGKRGRGPASFGPHRMPPRRTVAGDAHRDRAGFGLAGDLLEPAERSIVRAGPGGQSQPGAPGRAVAAGRLDLAACQSGLYILGRLRLPTGNSHPPMALRFGSRSLGFGAEVSRGPSHVFSWSGQGGAALRLGLDLCGLPRGKGGRTEVGIHRRELIAMAAWKSGIVAIAALACCLGWMPAVGP